MPIFGEFTSRIVSLSDASQAAKPCAMLPQDSLFRGGCPAAAEAISLKYSCRKEPLRSAIRFVTALTISFIDSFQNEKH
jgi:hypothetical protein